MSNYRNSAQARDLHDRAECPADCVHCQRIEAAHDEQDDNRDYLIQNYPAEWKDTPW